MRQVLPEVVDDVDPAALHAADDRPAPDGRPWVLVNMVTTADGATAVGGVSGPLGGPADKVVFAAIRGVADAILVGAGTVRAERYGPARRRPDGVRPRLAVVTASGDLDPGLRLFADADAADPPPLVLTGAACPPERRHALAAVAEVVALPGDGGGVDPAAALAHLHGIGARVVVAEGGPKLNGHLVAGDLVDEWCLTWAPLLAGGASSRPAHGHEPGHGPLRLRLARLLVDGDVAFARYLRA